LYPLLQFSGQFFSHRDLIKFKKLKIFFRRSALSFAVFEGDAKNALRDGTG
jgi:hypothetical protein